MDNIYNEKAEEEYAKLEKLDIKDLSEIEIIIMDLRTRMIKAEAKVKELENK